METQADSRTADTGQDDAETLSALDAAQRLGVSERTIRRAIARGDLVATKRGGQFQIAVAALHHFRQHRNGTPIMADDRTGPKNERLARPGASAPTLLVVAPTPPPRAALPHPLDPLIGRERELAELQGVLDAPGTRLVTLTGPGGVGKSRLALALAAALEERFADGAAFISLAAIADPDLVLPTIARTLGQRDAGDRPIADGLGIALRQREMLLVIDNVEQVVAGSPALVDLLIACPGLTILATSREPLRVSGEVRFPLLPLPVPAPHPRLLASDIAGYAGVALFLDRARRVRPHFALTADNAAAITAICARLDGLPLAIEMAAAWVGSLSPEALLERLTYRLPLLTGGNRDLPDRQRTMRDAIAWSYDLLTPEEQRCFRHLALFVGGFTLDAAERVVGASSALPGASVIHLVDALRGKSLLVEPPGSRSERLSMLETVREFALERLAASEDGELARQQHIAWCLDLAEQAWRRLWRQPLRLADLDWVEAEHDNLRAALGWLIDAGDGERALQLATNLAPFWYLRSHRQEGTVWLERATALTQMAALPIELAARVAHCLGLLVADATTARDYQTESLRIARLAGNQWAVAAALQSLVVLAIAAGRNDEATAFGEEALAIFESLGLTERISDLRCGLGRAAYARGELDRAFGLLKTSLTLARECEDPFSIGQALNALALVSVDRGERGAAATLFSDALATWLMLGSKDGLANCLAGVATLAATEGQWEVAARLLGAVSAMHLQVIVGTESRVESVRHARADREAAARGGMGFAAAREAGSVLPPEEAIAEAAAYLALTPARSPAVPVPAMAAHGLTQREREVLRLLASGLSDREIADMLFISRHTAMTHVSNILAKLGVSSRTAAAALAIRDGLA